jgi:hypothetical protein
MGRLDSIKDHIERRNSVELEAFCITSINKRASLLTTLI